jgi:prepilin-type N-terminal cleavage/methylation domain-containing protein
MSTSVGARHATRGFSMVELLVTIVLAGIIFAAMVPLFASALKKTSGDNLRVTATNIAQDRLEKVRQLNYADITLANLSSSTFANNQFGTSFTPSVGGKPYTITYEVSPSPSPSPQLSYKKVTVTVVWSGSGPNYTTTMKTIVMDPAAISATSTSNPYPTPTAGYTLTVAFKDARQLISPYVTVKYVQDGVTKTATPSPAAPFPLPSKTSTVTYYGLPGGINIPYTVTCRSSYISSSAPVFHLLTNGWIKFDTHPGGS